MKPTLISRHSDSRACRINTPGPHHHQAAPESKEVSFPLYFWRNWGLERESTFTKSQMFSGRMGIWIKNISTWSLQSFLSFYASPSSQVPLEFLDFWMFLRLHLEKPQCFSLITFEFAYLSLISKVYTEIRISGLNRKSLVKRHHFKRVLKRNSQMCKQLFPPFKNSSELTWQKTDHSWPLWDSSQFLFKIPWKINKKIRSGN